MKKMVKGAVLVPQKATFEILDKRYVFLVGADGVLAQKRIRILEELEDVFIVGEGISEKDQIVLEGLGWAKHGLKAEFEFEEPEEVFKSLKLHAE